MTKPILALGFVVLAVTGRSCPGCNYRNPEGPSAVVGSFLGSGLTDSLDVEITNTGTKNVAFFSPHLGNNVFKPGFGETDYIRPVFVGAQYTFSVEGKSFTCTVTSKPRKRSPVVTVTESGATCHGF